MRDVFIVAAARSAIGKRGKGLAGLMPADLLGAVQIAALKRSGVRGRRGRPADRRLCFAGQRAVVQHRAHRVAVCRACRRRSPRRPSTRSAARASRRPRSAPRWSAPVMEDIVMSCGIEMMTRVPLGSNMKGGVPMGASYMSHYQPTSQFMGAAMIAKNTRSRARTPMRSVCAASERAIAAWEARRLHPRSDAHNRTRGRQRRQAHRCYATVSTRRRSARDDDGSIARTRTECPGQGIHTAGSSSQVSDGAAAVHPRVGKSREEVRPEAARAHRRDDARRRRPGDDVEGTDSRVTQKCWHRRGSRSTTSTPSRSTKRSRPSCSRGSAVRKPDPDRVNPKAAQSRSDIQPAPPARA